MQGSYCEFHSVSPYHLLEAFSLLFLNDAAYVSQNHNDEVPRCACTVDFLFGLENFRVKTSCAMLDDLPRDILRHIPEPYTRSGPQACFMRDRLIRAVPPVE